MRRALGRLHVTPRTHARIGAPCGNQLLERLAVEWPALALHILRVPVKAQPAQIFHGCRGGARLVARMVEILHAKHNLPALRTGTQPRDHERARVPEVQRAGGRRGKPPHVGAFGHFFEKDVVEGSGE